MKASLAAIFAVLLILALFTAAKATTNTEYWQIYIRADGSIEPSDAPIHTLDNSTYYFTADVNGSITIGKSNITLDGNGHALRGNRNESGINMNSLFNVTIRDLHIISFTYGIYLNSTTNSTIIESRLTENNRSIELDSTSSFNRIIGNTMQGNNFTIYMESQSDFNVISDNSIVDNYPPTCISISECHNNTITGNSITNNRLDSVRLESSMNNAIINNNISGNHGYGIWLVQSSHNTIRNNQLADNNKSLVISQYSNSNTIERNNIRDNGVYGILINQGTENKFTHNNFISNTKHVSIPSPNLTNFWDDGLEGNYWSNYTGPDANHDGIGDNQHMLDETNIDHHPLMGTFHAFTTILNQTINTISNSTIINFMHHPIDNTIKLKVTNATDTQTHGFCRMTIPNSIIDPANITVIIDDGITPVLHANYALHQNATHIWIYFAYAHTTHEIVIIPEAPATILALLLLTAAAALVTFTSQAKRSSRR